MILGIKIDGYKHKERLSRVNKGCFNMVIIFIASGESFAIKRYKALSLGQVRKIENIMFETTVHNLNEFQEARIITYLEILHEVERVVYHADV